MGAHALALTWSSVIERLREAGANAELRVLAVHIGHPLDQGARRLHSEDTSCFTFGLPVNEHTWCEIRQYADAYDVKLVRTHTQTVELVRQEQPTAIAPPRPQLSLANLPTEAPGFTIALGTALGAAAGAVAGGAKGAAMGAIIGGGACLAAVGVSNAETSPATSQAAQTMFLGLTTSALGGSTARRVAAPASAPSRPALSRAERFDRADFEARGRRSTTKK